MAAQQGQGQADNSLAFLWIIIAVFAALILVWYLWHAAIVTFIFKIKLFEISIISLFTDGLSKVRTTILAMSPSSVTLNEIGGISTEIGRYLRFPVAVILGALSFILLQSSTKDQFKTIFSMKKLREQEKENWPQIAPINQLDLVKIDINKGKWAMAMTPMEFAKKYKLLTLEKKAAPDKKLSKDESIVAVVIRSRANQIFARQLGGHWQGTKHLKPHARALFAIFAAKANADRTAANKLLRQISASAEKGGRLNLSGADELLKAHESDKLIQKIVSSFAYENSVMAEMLEAARTDGVLATAEFLWLKPIDRSLWFLLNSVGRRVAVSEVAGPFAHWLAEREIGYRLTAPMIEEATNALEAAMADVLYKPDEGEVI